MISPSEVATRTRPVVDVGVEFGGGILGQLEQRAQAVPWPAVGLDPDVVRH